MTRHHRSKLGTRSLELVVAALLATALPACAGIKDLMGGTNVDAVATSVQRPANVAAYLEITDNDDPVVDLEPKSFKIYEDDKLLSAEDVSQRLLPRDLVTNERVVILLDLGGKPTPSVIDGFVKGVENFVERVQGTLPVTVLAYDGGQGLRLVADYPKVAGNPSTVSASALRSLSPRDASRDLNGAILKGIKELDGRLMQQKKPVRVGTLLVVARGPDLAGRATELQIQDALEFKRYNVVGIGAGEETPYLDTIARGGVVHAQSEATFPIAFEEAASRVLKTHGKYYLVSYCSPARAGTRSLRIEVNYTNASGSERSGSYYYDFDAQGFGPGCKSDTAPRFVTPRPENEAAPSAPPPAETVAPDPAQATSGGASPANGDVAPPPDAPAYK
jgi:hypothetical protein